VRAAVLLLIEEQPRNGYQLIQEISERSNDMWKPSPGSIYPVLQQLEDEGLIALAEGESGRTYRLTEQGATYVAEQREQLGSPWEDAAQGPGGPARELMLTVRQVAMAAKQVVVAGSPSQVSRASAVLADTRRAIYGILAEDDEGAAG